MTRKWLSSRKKKKNDWMFHTEVAKVRVPSSKPTCNGLSLLEFCTVTSAALYSVKPV